MDNEELVTTWCRLWGEEPDLARDVVAPDARHWSGEPGAPEVVDGVEDQVERAAGRGDGRAVAVVPGVLVDGGDVVAFLWDATGSGPSTTSGVDVLALEDGRVARSWTFVASRPAPTDDVPAPAGGSLDATGLAALAQSWLAVWRGPEQPVDDVVTGDFVAWSGAGDAEADLRGPDALAAHVERGREGRGAVSVDAYGDPVLDVGRQRLALLWSAREQEGETTSEVGGVDLLAVRDGRVSRSWTVRGSRPFGD